MPICCLIFCMYVFSKSLVAVLEQVYGCFLIIEEELGQFDGLHLVKYFIGGFLARRADGL